jgi:hypothetical protein
MAPQGITKTFDLGDGRIVSIETGKLAKQADGSVVVKKTHQKILTIYHYPLIIRKNMRPPAVFPEDFLSAKLALQITKC